MIADPAATNEPGFRNELLAVLSKEDVEPLRSRLQRVKLISEQVLHEPSEHLDHVYFPEEGVVCLTADTQDAGIVEVGMIGRDGMIGVSVMLNPDPTAVHRALVQVPGIATRMQTAVFNELVDRSPAFRDRCLRYIQVLMVQTAQAAACNARHELPERLARWLLMSHDKLDRDDMPMTQEFLAYMLGVRRTGVSQVANTLQSTGAIRQSRGRITILDRSLLEAEACNCYRFIEDSRRKIMG
ncbi:MAG: Crp/Fnr family transcriptional regulator [Oxalobacteraceae bacterium]|nr:MAG: Crp/Fnr family transcriptional regulator [Oxalobacteraceae bacterium]